MPATVFGGRGCMTRALWLRMSEIRKKCRRGVLPRNRTVRSFHKK